LSRNVWQRLATTRNALLMVKKLVKKFGGDEKNSGVPSSTHPLQ